MRCCDEVEDDAALARDCLVLTAVPVAAASPDFDFWLVLVPGLLAGSLVAAVSFSWVAA